MPIKPEWEIVFRRYETVLDKALDWYNLAQKKTGEDREWCIANYEKYKALRKTLSQKLVDISKEGILVK